MMWRTTRYFIALMVGSALILSLLVPSASAGTSTQAYTDSYLANYDNEFSAVTTISESSISTPDLNLMSSGSVNTELTTEGGGVSEIYQRILFTGSKNEGYGGSGSFYSSFSGTNVLEANSEVSGTVSTTISPSDDQTKVKSTSFGVGVATSNSSSYDFSVVGGHTTITTSPTQSVPLWMNEPVKEFELSFESDAVKLEIPADFFSEEVDLSYGVSENELAYYSYDFSRVLEVNGITCYAEMSQYTVL